AARLLRASARPREVARQEMGGGSCISRQGTASRILLGEVGRETLVEAFHWHVEHTAERLREFLGLRSLLAAFAEQRQRHSDDDPVRRLCADQLDQPLQPRLRANALDHAYRSSKRAGRVRHRDPGSRRPVVERDDLHPRAAALSLCPPANASAGPAGFLPPASARFGRPPPPPSIFAAAARATATASTPASTSEGSTLTTR